MAGAARDTPAGEQEVGAARGRAAVGGLGEPLGYSPGRERGPATPAFRFHRGRVAGTRRDRGSPDALRPPGSVRGFVRGPSQCLE